jgi:hypothetical protein
MLGIYVGVSVYQDMNGFMKNYLHAREIKELEIEKHLLLLV